jgi:hypothetical protein
MTTKFRAIFCIAILTGVGVCAPFSQGGGEKIFKGEIADTQCALNVHSLSQSHKEMMEMKPEIKTEADCARFCVKERGGRFVLQIKDKVFKLNAQAMAEQWAGQKVKVTGTLDPKTNIIIVVSMEPLEGNSGSGPRPN